MYDEDRLTSAELAREQAFALAQSASRTATMRSRVPPRVAHAFDLFDEPRRGILELRRLPAALEALDMSHSEPAVARELARYAGLSPLRPLDGLRSLRCSPRRLPFPTGTRTEWPAQWTPSSPPSPRRPSRCNRSTRRDAPRLPPLPQSEAAACHIWVPAACHIWVPAARPPPWRHPRCRQRRPTFCPRRRCSLHLLRNSRRRHPPPL